MSLYANVPQFLKMLRNLESWIDEAVEYAEARGFDPETLLQVRLYPDMFPLVRQIQSACDTAKFYVSRIAELEAPKHPDTETTLAEIRTRIAETIAFIESAEPAAFEGAQDRDLFLPMLRGGSITAADYAIDFALPNFYFHVVTAYDILRHSGVKLGKRRFLGTMNVKAAPSSDG